MSYILDALRRADAERDRGTVPGVHAQPAFAGPAPAARRHDTGRPWLWLGAGAIGVVAFGAVLWALVGRPGGPGGQREPVVATAPNAGTGVAANTPDASTVGTPPPIAMGAPDTPNPANTTSLANAPRALGAPGIPGGTPGTSGTSNGPNGPNGPNAASVSISPGTLPPQRAAATGVGPARLAPGAPAADPTADAGRSPRPAPGVAADRIEPLADLPPDVRRELPTLAVGGSMYSPTASARLLIVNGQVLHEGDALTPGLVLRQIRLKSAVFSFRDRRFEIRY